MTLKPNFIPIGSIVEYNGMINDIVGIIPPKPDKSKRFSDVWVVELSIGVICPLSDIKPIQLTPEILVEWCGFVYHHDTPHPNKVYRKVLDEYNLDLELISNFFFGGSMYDVKIEYLHELQLLFLGFKTVLPITIK
jgi:hypothetical protein